MTDVAALAIALVAIRGGQRPADDRRTFGYKRVEILAAAFNALLLFGVAIYVLIEAVRQFRDPEPVRSTGMMIVAAIGLVVNLISMRLLTTGQALVRMRRHGLPRSAELAQLVRGASSHGGSWPTLSVWHGDADSTVSPAYAAALLDQWRALHALETDPSETQIETGHKRRVWRDRAGRDVVEAYLVCGMGHGTPLQTVGEGGCGASGPNMLEVGPSSTRQIAAHWAGPNLSSGD